MVSVVINQPYYYPQLHWWERALRGDHVVLLDDVNHNSSFPINRALVHDGNKEIYLTIPIKKSQRHDIIKNIETSDKNWAIKHENAFSNYYRSCQLKSVYFFFDTLDDLQMETYLKTIIHNSIIGVLNEFKWPFTPIYSSNLNLADDIKKNDRLIAICKAMQADKLILGLGSKNYVEPDLLKYNENNISIEYQDWYCPVENYSVLHGLAKHGLATISNVLGLK